MRKRWQLILALAPAIIAFIVVFFLQLGHFPLPVLVGSVQIALLNLLILAGFLLSALALGVLFWVRYQRRLSEREAARERGRQEEAHRQFVRRLDHELQTPLSTLKVGLTNLRTSGTKRTTEAERISLGRLESQVDRLSKVIRDLRKLTDLQARVLEISRVDLAEILQEAIAMACEKPGRERRHVALSIQETPWRPGPVSGDRDLFVLALYNLVDNALKFSQPDEDVAIQLREEKGWVVVEVADKGRGIHPQDLPQLFDELYRGRNARDVEGSGLGLALVQRVVELHQGQIKVRSRLGEGTAVIMHLPLTGS